MIALCIPCASAADPLPDEPASVPQEIRAESQPEQAEFFVLSYQAPGGCPERAQFEELVRNLTPAAHFREAGQTGGEGPHQASEKTPRRMTITISQRARDFFGTLELIDEQTQARRQFDAETCEEIVDALALATALAIDPHALGGAADPIPNPKETPSEGENPETSESAIQGDESHADQRRRIELTLGVRGSIQALRISERSADAPGALTTVGMNVWEAAPTLEVHIGWGAKAGSSMHVSLGYAAARSSEVDFRWLPVGRLGVCPIWWKVVDRFGVGACGGLNVGRLESAPDPSILSAQTATRTYLSADVGPSLQVLFGNFRLGAGGGIVAPLLERRYVLASTAGDNEALLTLHTKPGPEFHVSAQWELF